MSACHQAHNIPWSILHDNLHIVTPNPSFPNRKYTNFYGRQNRPKQQVEVKHFARKFAETLHDFAMAERTKYDKKVETPGNKVLPDNMLGLQVGLASPPHGTILEDHQSLSFWLSEAPQFNMGSSPFWPAVIRELHFRNHSEYLLFLAQGVGEPLLNLRRVTYSHFFHYGTSRVYQDALSVYIIINTYLLFDLYGSSAQNPETSSTVPIAIKSVRDFIDSPLDCSDKVSNIYISFFHHNEYLQDTTKIKGFLKVLWRLLYLSDMYITECGGKIDWEEEVRLVLRYCLNLGKLDYE